MKIKNAVFVLFFSCAVEKKNYDFADAFFQESCECRWLCRTVDASVSRFDLIFGRIRGDCIINCGIFLNAPVIFPFLSDLTLINDILDSEIFASIYRVDLPGSRCSSSFSLLLG